MGFLTGFDTAFRRPYCKPEQGEHTALIYTSEDENEATIRQTLRRSHRVHVIRATEEPDASMQGGHEGKKLFPKRGL